MSINRGMDKEEVVHIYNGILLSHKKELNSAICRHMDRIRDRHSEWSKLETHIVSKSLICGMKKKWYWWTYLQSRNREQTYGYQGRRRVEWIGRLGLTYTLLRIKQITNV